MADWEHRPRCDEAPAWAQLAQEARRFTGDRLGNFAVKLNFGYVPYPL